MGIFRHTMQSPLPSGGGDAMTGPGYWGVARPCSCAAAESRDMCAAWATGGLGYRRTRQGTQLLNYELQ